MRFRQVLHLMRLCCHKTKMGDGTASKPKVLRSGLTRIRFPLIMGILLFLSCCTLLSNRSYLEQNPQLKGIKRVTVFIQRWPVYQKLPNQNGPGGAPISETTPFTGPWEPAGFINPRAVDIRDLDDAAIADLLSRVLTEKGYRPFVSGVLPAQPGPVTVAEIMAASRAVDPEVEAFLFCFYSPTVFCSKAQATPKDHGARSYGLAELLGTLSPRGDEVVWAGPVASQAPANSISHAFIYVSLTMFRALDWRPLWEVTDSQIGGRTRLILARCPPGPTDQNYPADAGVIQRLMTKNLACRLNHLIPDAF